jgi:hypothetical protein
MPARRTKRADGRFSVTARLESPDGTKRRTYFYGRTQAEAKAKAAAARDRVNGGEPVRDATRTLSEWLAEWRATFLRASDRAESTKDLYAGLTSRHVDPLIGHLPLGQVKPSDITRVLLHMEHLGRAVSTRRNTYAALDQPSMTRWSMGSWGRVQCCGSGVQRRGTMRRGASALTKSHGCSRALRICATQRSFV